MLQQKPIPSSVTPAALAGVCSEEIAELRSLLQQTAACCNSSISGNENVRRSVDCMERALRALEQAEKSANELQKSLAARGAAPTAPGRVPNAVSNGAKAAAYRFHGKQVTK